MALKFLSTAMNQIRVSEMNCSEFPEFLTKQEFHEDVVSSGLSNNRVCGASFCDLTEEDLKELLPVIDDRVRVRRLLQEVMEV